MNFIIIDQECINEVKCQTQGHEDQQIQSTCENSNCTNRLICGLCNSHKALHRDYQEGDIKNFRQLQQIMKTFKNSIYEVIDNIQLQTNIQRFINIIEMVDSIERFQQKEQILQNILSSLKQNKEQIDNNININNYLHQIKQNGIYDYLKNFRDQLIKLDNLKNDYIKNLENPNIKFQQPDQENQPEVKDEILQKNEKLCQSFQQSLIQMKNYLNDELQKNELFAKKKPRNQSTSVTILEFLMKQGYNMKSNVPSNQFNYLKDKFIDIYDQQDYLKAFQQVYSLKSKDYLEESLNLITSSILKNNRNRNSIYLKGIIQYEKKQYQEAVKTFQQCINLDKSYYDAYIGLGNSYRLIGNHVDAITSYDKALQIHQYSVRAYVGKATILKDQRKFEEAIIFYEKAIELEPSNVDAYCGKGISLHYIGKYEEAINIYETVINLDPKCIKAFINKGLAHQYLKNQQNEENYKDAILMFEKAIQLDPDCLLAYNHLGRALYQDKQQDRALKVYTQILTLDPTNLDGHLGKGELLIIYGKTQEAQKVFEKVLSLDPQNDIAKRRLNYLSQATIQN